MQQQDSVSTMLEIMYTSGRSEPGKGRLVTIHVMGPAEEFADEFITASNGICHASTDNEDYSRCQWPVVIKHVPNITGTVLAKYLRQAADTVADCTVPPDERDKDACPGARGTWSTIIFCNRSEGKTGDNASRTAI